MPFSGWNPIGIAALLTLVAGVLLLGVDAIRRGLVHGNLDGIDADPDPGVEAPGPAVRTADRSRKLAALGVLLLVAGLGMGLVAIVGGWSADQVEDASSGLPADDCAQSWEGCPTTTIRP
jgi:hypothetical protein